jgi:hypothetical protein
VQPRTKTSALLLLRHLAPHVLLVLVLVLHKEMYHTYRALRTANQQIKL